MTPQEIGSIFMQDNKFASRTFFHRTSSVSTCPGDGWRCLCVNNIVPCSMTPVVNKFNWCCQCIVIVVTWN